ncbi:hypothetical protein EGR_09422 [Echinococcus granulosus]|uniref:Uncharacterized protein n=1 Tax=Echinococcus granulosus TaxID=6210 RepID=W6UQK7_ECHGR|nr:hypothetical protein EGR_09422 [Echinococcus granulosus]EUB55709.1 hypothetical protein EGR_09422 [Echinococcus granulosus]
MNWAREVVTEFVCSYLIIHACVSEMKHTPRSNLVYRLKINEFRLSLELTVLHNASVAPIECPYLFLSTKLRSDLQALYTQLIILPYLKHDRLRDRRFSTYDMALLPSLQHLPFHNTVMTSSHAHQNKSWEFMQGSGADPDKLKRISTIPRREPSNMQHIDCYLCIL